jgi:hypothetical protein
MRHNPDRGIMAGLMREGRREVCPRREELDGWHRDAVGGAVVECAIAAQVDRRWQRIDEALRAVGEGIGRGHDADWVRVEVGRQPVDLVAVEDRVGAQHAAHLVGRVAGDDGFDGLAVGFVEDRDLRPLALADLAAKGLRLFVRHPGARVVAGTFGAQPQPEAVDALVGVAGRAQRTATKAGAPRLHPGTYPGFELVDDGVGDDIGRRGLVGSLCHERSPD